VGAEDVTQMPFLAGVINEVRAASRGPCRQGPALPRDRHVSPC